MAISNNWPENEIETTNNIAIAPAEVAKTGRKRISFGEKCRRTMKSRPHHFSGGVYRHKIIAMTE